MNDAKDKVARLLAVLQKTIRERGFTLTQIQNALGWERGSLVKELNAKEPLKVEVLLLVLDVIGMSWREFMAEVNAWEDAHADRLAKEMRLDLSPHERRVWHMLMSLKNCLKDVILICTEKKIFAANESIALLATLEGNHTASG